MTARKRCRFCGGRPAITPTGRCWTHGRPECEGSRLVAIPVPHISRQDWPKQAVGATEVVRQDPVPYIVRQGWPKRYRGRRVVTIPGPDTWNPKENAA